MEDSPLFGDPLKKQVDDALSDSRTPETIYIEKETMQELQDCIAELPENRQQVLELSFGLNGFREHRNAEIALIMGISASRVGVLKTSALATLYSKLRSRI